MRYYDDVLKRAPSITDIDEKSIARNENPAGLVQLASVRARWEEQGEGDA